MTRQSGCRDVAGLFLSRRRLAPQCGIGASLLEVGPGPSPRVQKCLSFFLHCDIGLVVELFSSPTGYDFKEGLIENWCLGLFLRRTCGEHRGGRMQGHA